MPPRTLRMDRTDRMESARQWLATQRGRSAARIARSYRKRYGVDRECAIAELSALGIVFDAKWREQVARTLEGARQAKVRQRADKQAMAERAEFLESGDTFAFIAGYTDGGVPFGVTWEEWARLERRAPIERLPNQEAPSASSDETLPF